MANEQLTLDILKILIDFIRVSAWPMTVISVAYLFQNEIKHFLDRMNKVRAGGVEIGATTNEQKLAIVKNQENDEVGQLAEEIRKYKNLAEELKKAQEQESQDKNLYRILYHFEKTYRIIFGSQLNILEALLNTPGKKLPKALVESMHQKSPISQWNFDEYIKFLISSYLVDYLPVENNFSLTPLGHEFLSYLYENKIPLNKPL